LKVSYKTNNLLQALLSSKRVTEGGNKFCKSGVYQLTCPDCGKKYTGQTGRSFEKRCKEDLQSFGNNNKNPGFAQHLLGNGHSFGSIYVVVSILQFMKKDHIWVLLGNFVFIKKPKFLVKRMTHTVSENNIFKTVLKREGCLNNHPSLQPNT
jgi:hypothetical protein